MRVLHLSEDGLPDWRIEKSALTALKAGHVVAFAGRNSDRDRGVFNKIFTVIWTAKARMGVPYYWNVVKKQVRAVLAEFRPDLVHAHNVVAAKMISEFDIPFVYDDHEYWSRHAMLLPEIERANRRQMLQTSRLRFVLNTPVMIRRALINRHCIKLWSKWERQIVSSHPTVTVSNEIAKGLKAIGQTELVFVVPNFPLATEAAKCNGPEPQSGISSVYAGSDGLNALKYPNRDIDGLTELFATNGDIGSLTIIGWQADTRSEKVSYTGRLSRSEMFAEMAKHSVGLLPWKKHWQHDFLSPNKPYEYAHAALLVICTSSLKEVIGNLGGNCVTFEDYADLAAQLRYLASEPETLYRRRINLFRFGQANLVWEKHEPLILNAYAKC